MAYAPKVTETTSQSREPMIVLDPLVLRAAQRIYRTYCIIHPQKDRRPCGIAIHRKSHRGQLIFHDKPILLPGECFVPTKQLEVGIF